MLELLIAAKHQISSKLFVLLVGDSRRVELLTNSEVNERELQAPVDVLTHAHVLCLQVAVRVADPMQNFKGLNNLAQHVCRKVRSLHHIPDLRDPLV